MSEPIDGQDAYPEPLEFVRPVERGNNREARLIALLREAQTRSVNTADWFQRVQAEIGDAPLTLEWRGK